MVPSMCRRAANGRSTATTDARAGGLLGARAAATITARVIAPGTHPQITRGKGTNIRHVTNILPEDDGAAHSLLVVEVITPGGNTSSYPPHKHDQDNLPHESLLEETYYHRLNPPQGFAFQRVYTDDRSLDEAMAIEDGDVTLVPRGYHPVATTCMAMTSIISTSWPGPSARGSSTMRPSMSGC